MNDARATDDARIGPSVETRIVAYDETGTQRRYDRVASEEPLEIRLRTRTERRTIAMTMRTPGHDFELAAGFLFGEGVISAAHDIREMTYCLDDDVAADQRYNIVNVDLASATMPPLDTLERHFLTSSACGVCGKANIDALRDRGLPPIDDALLVSAQTILSLPDKLRERQGVFARTGGLHAAALFDRDGRLLAVREDVGRHNALDKAIGWALLGGRTPLREHIVMVSGRTSYEIVQKALVARVPIVCAVSAPSSLAVDLAKSFGMTLVGFLRSARFNVYAGDERIAFAQQTP
jgi:FdhD protein